MLVQLNWEGTDKLVDVASVGVTSSKFYEDPEYVISRFGQTVVTIAEWYILEINMDFQSYLD